MTDLCIIGHGPSLYGSGKGKYIDNFEYVIRFPILDDWQKPIDYGTKTSYYCATTTKARNKSIKSFELGYFIWSKRGGKVNTNKFIDVTGLICSWQRRLPSTSYPYFSIGTAAICIAVARIGCPITVLGCDDLKIGKSDSKNYIGSWFYEKRYKDGIKFSKDCKWHSFGDERDLIDTMSKVYNVEITWI